MTRVFKWSLPVIGVALLMVAGCASSEPTSAPSAATPEQSAGAVQNNPNIPDNVKKQIMEAQQKAGQSSSQTGAGKGK